MKKKLAATLTIAVLGASALVAAPAHASGSDLGARVDPGLRTATLTELKMTKAEYSHGEQTLTGTATLRIDDLTGTLQGWSVSQQASNLVWDADDTDGVDGVSVGPAQLKIVNRGPVSRTDGLIGWVNQLTNGVSGPLNVPVEVMRVPTSSPGAYAAELNYQLTLPAQAAPGTYKGTITTTIAVATS